MKQLSSLSICLLAVLLICAGCVQQGNPPVSPSPGVSQGAVVSLPSLALTAADAPENFTLMESRAKAPDEVSDLARNLGWQEGYVVTFSGYPDDPMGATTITQTITVYPPSRMKEVLTFIKTNDRSDKELVITDLPSPGIGNESFAFTGKASSQIILRPKTGAPLEGNTLQGSFKQDVAEIVFYQDSTLEVLKMTGSRADPAVLESLAGKAVEKIPGGP